MEFLLLFASQDGRLHSGMIKHTPSIGTCQRYRYSVLTFGIISPTPSLDKISAIFNNMGETFSIIR